MGQPPLTVRVHVRRHSGMKSVGSSADRYTPRVSAAQTLRGPSTQQCGQRRQRFRAPLRFESATIVPTDTSLSTCARCSHWIAVVHVESIQDRACVVRLVDAQCPICPIAAVDGCHGEIWSPPTSRRWYRA